MKSKNLLVVVILFAIFACSKNDNATPTPVTPPLVVDTADLIVTTFLPTTNSIWWKYNTTTTVITPAPVAPATGITNGLDQLNVDSDLIIATIPYKLMKTTTTPTGFYSTMLNNNKLRVDGSSIKMTGNVLFNLGTNSIPLSVNNFTIFKENAIFGSNLGVPQTGTQNFTIPNSTQVIKVNYTLTSVADNDIASLLVGTTNYTNLKVVKIYVQIDASTEIAPGVSVQALNPTSQPVIISTQYWVKNVGVVKAETRVEYHLAGATAGVPQDGLQNVVETINSKSF
ncbi:MAG: hypothetical protein H7174_05390 [Flavobacterium sp.]|nr:hypothetical protein [Flavobacterium sp.]